MLLCGVFGFDAERPEDCVRRGHHRHPHPQEEEGRSEETARPALHKLLPHHVIQTVPPERDHSGQNPGLNPA